MKGSHVIGVEVLILVLMEYGLRLIPEESKEAILNCLNPCFNGIWSATTSNKRDVYCYVCLNPCFNGIWSATAPTIRLCV